MRFVTWRVPWLVFAWLLAVLSPADASPGPLVWGVWDLHGSAEISGEGLQGTRLVPVLVTVEFGPNTFELLDGSMTCLTSSVGIPSVAGSWRLRGFLHRPGVYRILGMRGVFPALVEVCGDNLGFATAVLRRHAIVEYTPDGNLSVSFSGKIRARAGKNRLRLSVTGNLQGTKRDGTGI